MEAKRERCTNSLLHSPSSSPGEAVWLLQGQPLFERPLTALAELYIYPKHDTITTTRTKQTYATSLRDFGTDALVECPTCHRQAIARTSPSETVPHATKVTCSHCGFNKRYEGFIIPVRLWLTTECEGQVLWARNYEHLDFLKQHVEAFLRERNTTPYSNSSLGSRLPRWMTSKKNRDKVLKCIERLKQKGI